MNNTQILLCLAVLAIIVIVIMSLAGKCRGMPAAEVKVEHLRGGGSPGRAVGGGIRATSLGGRGGGSPGGPRLGGAAGRMVPLAGLRRAASGGGTRGGAGRKGKGRGPRHHPHHRPRRHHRYHGGYWPYWSYSYGYPWYYWWYDSPYYYNTPYYLDFDDPCDDNALDDYKACIDAGTNKEECQTKLEGALDVCYASD